MSIAEAFYETAKNLGYMTGAEMNHHEGTKKAAGR
jgi:hypothetical protein